MKKNTGFIIIIALMVIGSASGSSFTAIGMKYLLIEANNSARGGIFIPFNNTLISVDFADDGLTDKRFFGNSGDLIELNGLDITRLAEGGFLYANKPIEYFQRLKYLYTVPPFDFIVKEYLLPEGTWHVRSDKRMTLIVDLENKQDIFDSVVIDRLVDSVFTIPAGKFARVYADQPFYVYSDAIFGPSGDDFFLPTPTVMKFIIAADNTNVKVDLDNNGRIDWSKTFDKGIQRGWPFATGARVTANNPIVIIGRFAQDDYQYILPSDFVKNDIWSKSYGDEVRIITPFKSNVSIDFVVGNDLKPEESHLTKANGIITMSNSDRAHIFADKKIMEIYSDYGMFPYSAISMVEYPIQVRYGTSELVPMEIRLANPFANKSAYNLRLNIKLPPEFSLPLVDRVIITVQRLSLQNDKIIEEGKVRIRPKRYGKRVLLRLDGKDISYLERLDPMSYLSLRFHTVSPKNEGEYAKTQVEFAHSLLE